RGVVQASARRCVKTGVQAAHVDCGTPRLRRDELLDLLAPIPGQQQEVLEPLGDVDLNHVPDDRPAADLDERLGDRLSVLLKPSAPAAAQDRDGWLGGAVHAADYPIKRPPGSIRARWARSPIPRSSRPTTSAGSTEATSMPGPPSRSAARS